MITLAKHIEILLLEHDCVVVPGFGGFIANYAESQVEAGEQQMLYPPYRTVRFNQSLQENDGLLVHSYMMAYDAAYPAALKQMQMEVNEVKDGLSLVGRYALENIGVLRADLQGRITFEADESGVTTPSLYGLSSLMMLSLEQAEKQRAVQEELAQTSLIPVVPVADETPKTPSKHLVLRIPRRWVDVAIAAAASVVLFFLFSYPAMHEPSGNETCVAGTLSVKSPERKTVSTEISAPKTIMAVPTPKQEKAETAEVKVPAEAQPAAKPFRIVLASYVGRANADDYIRKMAKKGFPEARFEMTGRVSRVLYSAFADKETAEQALSQLRKQSAEFAEAWILEVK